MGSDSAHLVDEVLVSFGIRVDPWTMEYKDAVDKIEREFQVVRQEGFDEGFDEGQYEADNTNHDDAYDEGLEDGRSNATLYHVVENYMQLQFRIPNLRVIEIVPSDHKDNECSVRFTYVHSDGTHRNELNVYSFAELFGELM